MQHSCTDVSLVILLSIAEEVALDNTAAPCCKGQGHDLPASICKHPVGFLLGFYTYCFHMALAKV